ncbi:uncharacterized protein LOC101888436 [Musca domestica]|uniref:Uncharacterized protein LOC101888436 n=1 Tax=Musca domestica TaxID=7370 RepID=A0A9J7I4K1_MUSDO|nr:uncharacterized protein LOC101888436 [Musca domestica]
MKAIKTTDILAPRPVHPRAIRNHGLFESTFLRQHMVIDERWSMGALIDEFQGMADLLSKRMIFKRLENRASRKGLLKSARRLRLQCRDGRTKLQNVLFGDNVLCVRNFLINHKDMQRLYEKMPVHMVVDNINQRTFVMRKERDRLTHRLRQLKSEYELKIVQKGEIENRIKYQNEFVLDEELQMRDFEKNIENSNTRLRAIKAVNATYRKIIEVLRHDGIFYEPILRSLCEDINDQASFIKHILYLGTPAIAKFKQLGMEYRQMEDKSRKSAQIKLENLTSFNESDVKPGQPKGPKPPELVVNMAKHYTRETKSMLSLQHELESIEAVIKQIKEATLCSKATEIFPRIKTQVEINFKLIKQNELGHMQTDYLAFKERVAAEQQSILLNNYFEEEERRLKNIKDLEEQIKLEDAKEVQTLAHMKNRAAVFVILRYALWNISDIVRHVGRPPRVHKIQYPTPYLKLPLLKYEMLTMYAVPPELFEEDTKTILQNAERKLKTLMEAYEKLLPSQRTRKTIPFDSAELTEDYHQKYLASMELEDLAETSKPLPEDEDVLEDAKISHNIPNRKQLKAQSAKLVEELSKREE